jgi:hypothetical protein
MAWTAPRTWVTGETVTAALMNAHIRDNLLETSAATVTTAGDLAYADAANSMGSRVGIGAANTHLVSTGSAPVWRAIATDADTGSSTGTTTSYADLGNVGDWSGFSGNPVAVSLTTGTEALVLWKATLSNNTAGSITFLSYAVATATTVAAADTHSISYESGAAADRAHFGGFDLVTGLNAGTNDFRLYGRVDGNTGTINRPEIAVVPF